MTVSSNRRPEKEIKTLDYNHIGKSYIVEQLILMVENIDDTSIRCDCLKALENIDFKSNKLFFDLENLLISDSEDEIRKQAAIIIGKKFDAQGIDPLIFSILHEKRYDNLLTILLILEKFKVSEIHEILLRKLSQFSGLNINNLKNYPSNQLIHVLINQLTLSCLERKFNNLEYKQKCGYIYELDFSKVNNKILDWHYREMIQDHTEIHGIKHLTRLEKVTPFSLSWAIRNDFTMHCQVELLKTVRNLKFKSISGPLITLINNIDEIAFKTQIRLLLDTQEKRSNLSIPEIIEIYLNYLIIEFLKKKAPGLDFKLKGGRVTLLNIENVKLIKVPAFIRLLTSLKALRLHKCSIYEFPEFILYLKKLKRLDLSYNKINHIPESVIKLKFLNKINLQNNPICSKPSISSVLKSLIT